MQGVGASYGDLSLSSSLFFPSVCIVFVFVLVFVFFFLFALSLSLRGQDIQMHEAGSFVVGFVPQGYNRK